MKDYLVNTRGPEAERFTILEGGYREKKSAELWLSPRGTAAPSPSPSVDPSYVQSEKRKPARPARRS